MSGPATSVYLPSELRAKLVRLADAQGRSASSVIVEAVRLKLARGEQTGDGLTAHQLRRIDARLDRIVRDTMLVKESVLLFVRVWLEHNPPLDETIEDAAAASAAARFERFLDYVANSIDAGRSVTEQSGAYNHDAEPASVAS